MTESLNELGGPNGPNGPNGPTGQRGPNGPLIAYKVVADTPKGLRSMCGQRVPSVTVTYRIGEWAQPKLAGSKLFCFASLEAARHWAPFHSIFTCEVMGVEQLQYRTIASEVWFGEFWALHRNGTLETHGQSIHKYGTPLGTWCVDSLRLIERVR